MQEKSYYLAVWGLLWLTFSCAHLPEVTGKWQQVGKTAILEFKQDRTFRAIDNQGMAVSGKYGISKKNKVRFEITHENASPEILKGKICLKGESLILISGDGKEKDVYQRVEE